MYTAKIKLQMHCNSFGVLMASELPVCDTQAERKTCKKSQMSQSFLTHILPFSQHHMLQNFNKQQQNIKKVLNFCIYVNTSTSVPHKPRHIGTSATHHFHQSQSNISDLIQSNCTPLAQPIVSLGLTMKNEYRIVC